MRSVAEKATTCRGIDIASKAMQDFDIEDRLHLKDPADYTRQANRLRKKNKDTFVDASVSVEPMRRVCAEPLPIY